MLDKKRFIWMIGLTLFFIWIIASYEFYKNHKLQAETTASENYRMKLYNSAVKINDEATQRCADMAMKKHNSAISDSIRCLKAIIK